MGWDDGDKPLSLRLTIVHSTLLTGKAARVMMMGVIDLLRQARADIRVSTLSRNIWFTKYLGSVVLYSVPHPKI